MNSIVAATRTQSARRWKAAIASTCVFGVGFPALLAQSVESLLPPDTAITMFVNDFEAYAASSKSLPIAKILSEPEVQKFLEKPKAAFAEALASLRERMQKEEGFQDIELDPEKMLAGEYGRMFLAFTHFEFTAEPGNVPDIGLIVGIERRQGAPDWLALVKDGIARLAANEGAKDVHFEATEEEGVKFEILRGANEAKRVAICAADIGGLQLISISKRTLLGVLHRLQGEGPALADDKDWQIVRKELGESRADSLQIYVDVAACMAMTNQAMDVVARIEPNFAEMLPAIHRIIEKSGFLEVGASLAVEQATNGVSETRGFTSMNGPAKGFMKAFAPNEGGIDLAQLKAIPENTASFSIFQLDPASLYDFLLDATKEASPESHDKVVSMLDSLGAEAAGDAEPIRLREDLFANLGPTFLMITPKKFSMMQPIPPMLFATEVRNGDRVLNALDKILVHAAKMAGQTLKIDVEDRKSYVLHLVSLGSQFSSFRPAYTVANGYFYLSTDPGLLKQHIKRLEKGDVIDITSNPDYQRFASNLPTEGVTSMSYNDTRYSFETMYDMAISMLPIATSMIDVELPIDLQLAPMRETISQHLFGSFGFTQSSEHGVRTASFGSMGVEVAIVAIAGAAGVGAFVVASSSIEKPNVEFSFSTPRNEEAQSEVAMRDMNSLSSHVLIYRLETGTTPTALDDLKKPIKNYSSGVWTGDLPKDPWGNAYLYAAEGKEYRLWSKGPNSVDEQGAGDDLVRMSGNSK